MKESEVPVQDPFPSLHSEIIDPAVLSVKLRFILFCVMYLQNQTRCYDVDLYITVMPLFFFCLFFYINLIIQLYYKIGMPRQA